MEDFKLVKSCELEFGKMTFWKNIYTTELSKTFKKWVILMPPKSSKTTIGSIKQFKLKKDAIVFFKNESFLTGI